MKILYEHFIKSRKELIGTDIEVIIDLIYRYDEGHVPDNRFYRKTNIDEIRDLVNDPNFPAGYTEFALYNDHLLYNTWNDFRNQVNPEMTLAKYVKLVFNIVVVTHIYRMDTKHKEFCKTNGIDSAMYNNIVIDACLEEHVCWFPSEEQTRDIIERIEGIIQHMSGLIKSEVEKPFGEELPESVRKETVKPKTKEVPTAHQKQFDDLLVEVFEDKDHPFVKTYHNELVTAYLLGRVNINGSSVNEATCGTVKCMWKSYVTEKLRDYHNGYLTPSCIRHTVFKAGTMLQQAVLADMDAWEIILNLSLVLLVENKIPTDDTYIDDPDLQVKQILTGVDSFIHKRYSIHGITTVEDYNRYKETGKYPSSEKEELPDDWNPVEKSWDEFRDTGLVQITNQFLHIFGWALTYLKDGDEFRVFPARVRYRGFDVDSQTRAYEKLQKYMMENAETLYKESDYEDEED